MVGPRILGSTLSKNDGQKSQIQKWIFPLQSTPFWFDGTQYGLRMRCSLPQSQLRYSILHSDVI